MMITFKINLSWRVSMLYDIGEKPGKGTYQCTSCDSWKVTLDDDSDALPPCGKCGKGQKIKYRKIS